MSVGDCKSTQSTVQPKPQHAQPRASGCPPRRGPEKRGVAELTSGDGGFGVCPRAGTLKPLQRLGAGLTILYAALALQCLYFHACIKRQQKSVKALNKSNTETPNDAQHIKNRITHEAATFA
eukprot:g40299.t1